MPCSNVPSAWPSSPELPICFRSLVRLRKWPAWLPSGSLSTCRAAPWAVAGDAHDPIFCLGREGKTSHTSKVSAKLVRIGTGAGSPRKRKPRDRPRGYEGRLCCWSFAERAPNHPHSGCKPGSPTSPDTGTCLRLLLHALRATSATLGIPSTFGSRAFVDRLPPPRRQAIKARATCAFLRWLQRQPAVSGVPASPLHTSYARTGVLVSPKLSI